MTTAPLVILCLHRVLRRDSPGAWPYFLRGTAITPEVLRALLAGLCRAGRFVDASAPLDPRSRSDAPRFWLTFDDGYADTRTTALPILEDFGATATAFVTTGAILGDIDLPADRWNAVVSSARRARGRVAWNDIAFDADTTSDEGRAKLAMGWERAAFLRADAASQGRAIEALERALDGHGATAPGLYLDRDDVRDLTRAGWAVGGHGATHAILPTLGAEELQAELTAMDEGLRRLGAARPVAFAYPDGQRSSDVEQALATRGVPLAVTLGATPVAPEHGRLRLPRFVVPNDPTWVERSLLPTLGA